MRTRTGQTSLLPFYWLLVMVGGVLAHIASEFGAMGADARDVLVSPRHWYLAVAVLAGAVVFAMKSRRLIASTSSGRDLKRVLHVGLASLPLRGRGVAFYALTAILQFAVGLSTEVGEGAPIAGHDITGGVLGALLVVVALALASKAIARTLPSVVEALAWLLAAIDDNVAVSGAIARRIRPAVLMPGWTPHLFNRPPPALRSV